ncbi:MAG TPA: hypothetical protein VFU98_13205 [Microlunatus sp.]|nr:hypothetical protein [Microlunatus sp.]
MDRSDVARTAHVVVVDDVAPETLTALADCRISRDSGSLHISTRLHTPAETYDLLERIRRLGMTLISLSVEVDE